MKQRIFKERIDNFEEKILKALYEKYGLFPDGHITKLLEEELETIKSTGKINEVIILYDFTNWLKKKRFLIG